MKKNLLKENYQLTKFFYLYHFYIMSTIKLGTKLVKPNFNLIMKQEQKKNEHSHHLGKYY